MISNLIRQDCKRQGKRSEGLPKLDVLSLEAFNCTTHTSYWLCSVYDRISLHYQHFSLCLYYMGYCIKTWKFGSARGQHMGDVGPNASSRIFLPIFFAGSWLGLRLCKFSCQQERFRALIMLYRLYSAFSRDNQKRRVCIHDDAKLPFLRLLWQSTCSLVRDS